MSNPDSFDKAAIRQIVHSFYNRREYLTLTGVWREAKEKGVFSAGQFGLWRCLKEWDLYTRNRTQNVTYMNRKRLLNNDMQIHEYTDMKTDQLFIQTRRGLTHIYKRLHLGR